jgi:hypothetical protein
MVEEPPHHFTKDRDNNYSRFEPMTNHTLQKLGKELTIEQIENQLFYLGDGCPCGKAA